MPYGSWKKRKSIKSSGKPRSWTTKNYRGMRKYKTSQTRRIPNAAPNSVIRYLNYQEEYIMDPTTGSYDVLVYKANGLYDPRVATGGHQPYGFDALMTQYQNFKVYESSIRVYPTESAVQDSIPCYVAVIPSTTPTLSTLFSDTSHFLEYCRKNNVKVYTVGAYITQNSALNQIPYAKWSLKENFGGELDKSESTWGTASADPTTTTYFRIYCYSIYNNNPAARTFRIDISYKAKFFNKAIQPES